MTSYQPLPRQDGHGHCASHKQVFTILCANSSHQKQLMKYVVMANHKSERIRWQIKKDVSTLASGCLVIFVTNLSPVVTEQDLYTHFRKIDPVFDVFIPKHKVVGGSRGFVFVRFKTEWDAKKAINSIHGHSMGDDRSKCKWQSMWITIVMKSVLQMKDRRNLSYQVTRDDCKIVFLLIFLLYIKEMRCGLSGKAICRYFKCDLLYPLI